MGDEGWEEVELGQLIDVKHGFAFKGEYFKNEPPGDILLTPGNFAIGGGFKYEKLKYYDGPVPEDYVLIAGELLVTMTDLSKAADTLGYPAVVPGPENDERYLHNQRLGLIHVNEPERLHRYFLYYLMCSGSYRHEIVAGATGTTVKHTSPTKIKRFRAQIPPFPEQRSIANILGTLDDKIELNRQMNRTLEVMARAIFKAWFVDFEPVKAKAAGATSFRGMPQAVFDQLPDRFTDTELGPVPAGWEVGTVSDLGNVICGKTPSTMNPKNYGDDVPFITIPDMHRKVFATTTNKRLSETGANTQRKKFLPKNSICVSCIATPGLVVITSERAQTNQQINSVIPREDLSPYFCYETLSRLGEQIRAGGSGGSVFHNLNKTRFSALNVLLPPSIVGSCFHKMVAPIYGRILVNEDESHILASLRDTLLPKLISGELRVQPSERASGECVCH